MSPHSLNPFGDDEDEDITLNGPSSAWGDAGKSEGRDSLGTTSDILKDTIKKEAVIREIMAGQEDLKALLARVITVREEVDKLHSGNATLQMYIDNLTKQVAKR